MVFWYFSFEGRFKKPEPEFGCLGVGTNCLIPTDSYEDALELFHEALEFKGISLFRMYDEIPVDEEELDPENEDHQEWIELFAFTKEEDCVVFTEYNVFDPE